FFQSGADLYSQEHHVAQHNSPPSQVARTRSEDYEKAKLAGNRRALLSSSGTATLGSLEYRGGGAAAVEMQSESSKKTSVVISSWHGSSASSSSANAVAHLSSPYHAQTDSFLPLLHEDEEDTFPDGDLERNGRQLSEQTQQSAGSGSGASEQSSLSSMKVEPGFSDTSKNQCLLSCATSVLSSCILDEK
ncbi:unnamed protein product, partial [Amoebophrya sp. A120]